MDYKALYEQSQKELAGLKSVIEVITPQVEKLKKESERLERLRITFINRYGELKKIVCPDSQFQDHKRIREGCLKLKKENEEKNHTILTWKMSASLKDTEINELTDELEKMKAFINQLKVNVVKLEEDEDDEDNFGCYFDGVKIESIIP